MKRDEGVVLGKPSTIPRAVQQRILTAHRAGRSLSAIARDLDSAHIPAQSGSPRWHHSVVGGVVRRAAL